MSFRITTFAEGDEITIRLEGRLTADGLPDLRREIRLAGRAVRLDLSGLTSADADGVRELVGLSARGSVLFGASAYICQLSDEASV
jgi:anti-anti-sigma regulatory factor